MVPGVPGRFRDHRPDEGPGLGDRKDATPRQRLRYGGSAGIWGFALYLAGTDKHEDSVLPTGSFAGTPEEALDCAGGLYLTAP